MIKRKYILSSSFNMSKRYAENTTGIGLTPITFKELVLDLYSHPSFIFENKHIEEVEFYKQDIKLFQAITESNYFYKSKDYIGSRKLIHKALYELHLSCMDINEFNLPSDDKGSSLKELYRILYDSRFDYRLSIDELLKRIKDGVYDSVLDTIELIILDKPHLLGYENSLYDILVEKVQSIEIESSKSLDFSRTTTQSSITKRGNINHLLNWMEEHKLNSVNTVVVALDYDKTVSEFYTLSSKLPIHFSKGIKCSSLSFFEPLLTVISKKRLTIKDDIIFIDKVESLVREFIKNSEGLGKIFYEKVLVPVLQIKEEINSYIDAEIYIDILYEIINKIENIYISQTELGFEETGLQIVELEDVYKLEFENIAVMGLDNNNYPPKVRLDPILKVDERVYINETTNSLMNLEDIYKDNMLEYLLTNVSGFSFLCYESHDEGKLTVPSIFFNRILDTKDEDINVEEVYKLCNVKDSYRSDILSQGKFAEVTSIVGLGKTINNFKRELYSYGEIDSDYGNFTTLKKDLSATSLTTYFTCPYSFNLRYNHKIYFPDLGTADLTTWLDSGKRGELLHRLYENYINIFIKQSNSNYKKYLVSTTKENLEELFNKTLITFIEEYKLDNDVPEYIKQQEIEEIKDNFYKFIESEINYSDEFYPIQTEMDFISNWDVAEDKIVFTGKIDRVDTDGLGNYRIWDYKTGKNPYDFDKGYLFCVENQFGPKINFQHALYLKALQDMELYSDIKSIQAGYYYTSDTGKWSKVVYDGIEPLSKQNQILERYISECKTGKYYKNPKSCKFCDYKSICSNNQFKRETILEQKIGSILEVLGE